MLTAMPFVILTTVIFRRSVTESYRRIRVAIARINAYLQEHITGIVVLQLFNRERRAGASSKRSTASTCIAYKDAITAYGWFYPVVEFISMLALAGILTYGGFRVQAGTLSLGVVAAFLQYGLRFFRPIQDLSEKYNILQSAMASARAHLQTAGHRAHRGRARRAARPAPQAIAPIEFDHVWFAYKDEDWVLRDVSFTIAPGETIAVVGHTGAGKTTSSASCSASTTCSAAASASAASTCATSTRSNCAACSASSCRTPSCSPARWRKHPPGHRGHQRRRRGGRRRTGQPDGLHPHPARGFRHASASAAADSPPARSN